MNDRLFDLLEQWEEAYAQGRELTPEALCPDDPVLCELLRQRIIKRKLLDAILKRPAVGVDLPESPAVPGYEVLRELGRGGMGVVYLARDVKLGREVALKMIRPGAHDLKDSLARFQREARILSQLQHPHVVKVYAWGECQGRPYFVQEYVAGGALRDHPRRTALTAAQAAQLVEVLARTLHAVHRKGILHRDLKPANVLLAAPVTGGNSGNTELGFPMVSDFGLARPLQSTSGQTNSFAIVGTPEYMAPEQASGRNADLGPAADIYALGAILYQLLAGRPPFQEDNVLDTLEQVRHQPPRPLREVCPSVPPELEALCLRCLAKSPAERPPSALALAEDLQRFLRGETQTLDGKKAPPARVPEPRVPSVRRRWPYVALAGVLLGAALVWWHLGNPKPSPPVAPPPANQAELKLLYECEGERPHQGVPVLAMAPDGRRVFGGVRHVGRIWDVATGKLLHTLPLPNPSIISAAAFSPDGSRLATNVIRRGLGLMQWETTQFSRISLQQGDHIPEAMFLAYLPNGPYTRPPDPNRLVLLSVGNYSKASFLDVVTEGRLLTEFHYGKLHPPHLDAATAVSHDRQRWVTGRHGHGGKFDLEPLRVWNLRRSPQQTPQELPLLGLIPAITFSHDDQTIFAAIDRPQPQPPVVYAVALRESRILWQQETPCGNVSSLAASPDGRWLAVGRGGCPLGSSLEIWDAATGRKMADHRTPGASCSKVCFTPDGHTLICGDDIGDAGIAVRAFRLHTWYDPEQ